jgi:endonuclease G
MKKLLNLIALLFLIPLFLFSLDFVPVCENPRHVLLNRNGYDNCFDVPLRVSHFVTYRLTRQMVEVSTEGRHSFRRDSDIPNSLRTEDYTRSGYDRGHLVPAGDMSSNAETARDAGLRTNIVPQFPNFNRYGLWRERERHTQELAKQHGEIIVVSGPLYISEIEGFIIPVPSHYFRMIIFRDEHGEINYTAYIFPHTNDSHRNIHDYRVPFEEAKRLIEKEERR